MWHDLFISHIMFFFNSHMKSCISWISHAWHDLFTMYLSVTWLIQKWGDFEVNCSYMTWLIMRDMTRSWFIHMRQDSFANRAISRVGYCMSMFVATVNSCVSGNGVCLSTCAGTVYVYLGVWMQRMSTDVCITVYIYLRVWQQQVQCLSFCLSALYVYLCVWLLVNVRGRFRCMTISACETVNVCLWVCLSGGLLALSFFLPVCL